MLRGKQYCTSFFIIVGIFCVYILQVHRRREMIATLTRDCDLDYRQNYNKDGLYIVIENYLKASSEFADFESITYATHAEFAYLGNLEEIVNRWKGPVSVAVYAPGSDFTLADQAIRYAHHCVSPAVSQYVTFHVFWHKNHPPPPSPEDGVDCGKPPPWTGVDKSETYRTAAGLVYPVNVARNIARESSTTYYILSSDIELYPSEGIISSFLEMASYFTTSPYLKVFPLPVFEISDGVPIPRTKEEIVNLVNQNKAISFHDKVCRYCHRIPELEAWLAEPPRPRMSIHYITKREGIFAFWEPFYIGTHCEPLFDERLPWEGEKDKMIQAYEMCVIGYDFCVLSDSFLVHKPGIKNQKVHSEERLIRINRTNYLLQESIVPELRAKYGFLSGMFCRV